MMRKKYGIGFDGQSADIHAWKLIQQLIVLKCEWRILTERSSYDERVPGPYGSKTRRQPTGTPIGLSSSSAREI